MNKYLRYGLLALCLSWHVSLWAAPPLSESLQKAPTIVSLTAKAEQGDADAQLGLAYLYYKIKRNLPEAQYWAHRGLKGAEAIAHKGNVGEQMQLGYTYSYILVDYAKSLYWYKEAAKHGNKGAWQSIGHIYE